MKDYLLEYMKPNGFDLPRLFNDDYFNAVRLLWNNKHYVSAMKLLLSFLDTVAYLASGDTPGNFQQWLNNYADLASLGVTADELWELRNSLLHMTNCDSRKVARGKVRRILFYMGTLPPNAPQESPEAKFLGFWPLIQVITEATSRYCQSFNADRSKVATFIDRYDCVLSDSRYLVMEFPQS